MGAEASLKIDAVIISTAAATEEALRGLNATTIFRIKEGDESAVPTSLRDMPFQLVKILAGKEYSDRKSRKATIDNFLVGFFLVVIGAVLGAIFTAIVKS